MIGSLALAGSAEFLRYSSVYVSWPVSPWSMSGWKNWFTDAHVSDMITVGFQEPFSTFAMPWVQYTPVVWSNSASAPDEAAMVNWFFMLGAVGSCGKSQTRVMPVPLMAS